MTSKLPPARIILDIGGANYFLTHLEYHYYFEHTIVLDLPPDERCKMYKSIELKGWNTPHGRVDTMYGNAANLNGYANESIDLVWMGQVVEHVDPEEFKQVLSEIHRVLKPTGSFCLNTPNRHITKIHTTWMDGGYIHPEHKKSSIIPKC